MPFRPTPIQAALAHGRGDLTQHVKTTIVPTLALKVNDMTMCTSVNDFCFSSIDTMTNRAPSVIYARDESS
jgi:hypothetical protein